MVSKTYLETIDQEKAKELLIFLDKTEVKPTSFFWFYIPDIQAWRLVISSNYFKNMSKKDSYREFIIKFKNNNIVQEIGVENITLLQPDNGIIMLLRSVMKTDPKSVNGIRFKYNTIKNIYIDDAYIYRLS